jgi:hypothetical protein
VLFFEPSIVELNPPPDLARRVWAVRVSAGSDPTLALAARGARRTLLVVAAGALTLGLGLFITVRCCPRGIRRCGNAGRLRLNSDA